MALTVAVTSTCWEVSTLEPKEVSTPYAAETIWKVGVLVGVAAGVVGVVVVDAGVVVASVVLVVVAGVDVEIFPGVLVAFATLLFGGIVTGKQIGRAHV